MSSFTPVTLDHFDSVFGSLIELSSVALGGSITGVSDDFFADAINLLSVNPAVSMKGQFGPKGALFDGWESRRHNPTYDWTIIKLGAVGCVHGVDIDTANFNGNESPASDVWGANVPAGESISEDSPLWSQLLPVSPLGPSSRHLFKFTTPSPPVTHLKLTMHPDGGLGRFRAYGRVVPVVVADGAGAVDLASVLGGATVTGESDQHFGRGGNLILPGRGIDMGDGWETKRSRGRLGSGTGDWVVIKLGEPGYLEWVDLDTLHFVGNFPESAQLFGIHSSEDLPAQGADWTLLLDRTKLGPHRQHFFQLSHRDKAWTHVRLSIYPDGGMKRVRVYGRPASLPLSSTPLACPAPALTDGTITSRSTPQPSSTGVPRMPALPLTPDAFSAYGSVIQSYPDQRSARKDVVIKAVNFGTAFKFNRLSDIAYTHPSVAAKINFCVFRCDAQDGEQDIKRKMSWNVDVLERHEFSTQAFVPMGGGGGRYLIVVALPGPDSKPDLSTLRAFLATSAQGISYHPNVWHHPIIALDVATDFSCVVYESGVDAVDCEIQQFGKTVAVVEEV